MHQDLVPATDGERRDRRNDANEEQDHQKLAEATAAP